MMSASRRLRLLIGVSLTAVSLAAAAPALAGGDDLQKRKARPATSQAALKTQITAETQRLIEAEKARHEADSAAKQAQIDALMAQVQDLAAQVKALQDKAGAAPVQTAAAPPPTTEQLARTVTPTAAVSVKNATASITSATGDFSIAFRGLFQLDAASYFQDSNLPSSVTARDLNSGTNFRRARLGIVGKAYKDFEYTVWIDFGGSGAEDVGRFHEAWIQYNGFKPAKIRLGEFAPSVGLADSASQSASPFLERPASAEIARGFAGGDTRIALSAFKASDRFLWALALTGNTVSTLNTQSSGFTPASFDEQLGMTARIAGTPFKGEDWLLHAGLNYSAIINPADSGPSASNRYVVQLRDRPELRVDGARLVDTGAIDAENATVTGVELGWQSGPFFAQGEAFQYTVTRRDAAAGVTHPDFSGWYVEGGWSLTGETRRYNTATAAFDGITPDHNFDPQAGRWGAWELVARYSNIDLDHNIGSAVAADRVRGGQQDIVALGLGWTLNPSVRFIFQGQDVKVTRMSGTGALLDQQFQTFAVRSQFGF